MRPPSWLHLTPQLGMGLSSWMSLVFYLLCGHSLAREAPYDTAVKGGVCPATHASPFDVFTGNAAVPPGKDVSEGLQSAGDDDSGYDDDDDDDDDDDADDGTPDGGGQEGLSGFMSALMGKGAAGGLDGNAGDLLTGLANSLGEGKEGAALKSAMQGISSLIGGGGAGGANPLDTDLDSLFKAAAGPFLNGGDSEFLDKLQHLVSKESPEIRSLLEELVTNPYMDVEEIPMPTVTADVYDTKAPADENLLPDSLVDAPTQPVVRPKPIVLQKVRSFAEAPEEISAEAEEEKTCHVLVLSGAGVKGAFQAGAVVGLAEQYMARGVQLRWDVVSGVSFGGVAAAFSLPFEPGMRIPVSSERSCITCAGRHGKIVVPACGNYAQIKTLFPKQPAACIGHLIFGKNGELDYGRSLWSFWRNLRFENILKCKQGMRDLVDIPATLKWVGQSYKMWKNRDTRSTLGTAHPCDAAPFKETLRQQLTRHLSSPDRKGGDCRGSRTATLTAAVLGGGEHKFTFTSADVCGNCDASGEDKSTAPRQELLLTAMLATSASPGMFPLVNFKPIKAVHEGGGDEDATAAHRQGKNEESGGRPEAEKTGEAENLRVEAEGPGTDLGEEDFEDSTDRVLVDGSLTSYLNIIPAVRACQEKLRRTRSSPKHVDHPGERDADAEKHQQALQEEHPTTTEIAQGKGLVFDFILSGEVGTSATDENLEELFDSDDDVFDNGAPPLANLSTLAEAFPQARVRHVISYEDPAEVAHDVMDLRSVAALLEHGRVAGWKAATLKSVKAGRD